MRPWSLFASLLLVACSDDTASTGDPAITGTSTTSTTSTSSTGESPGSSSTLPTTTVEATTTAPPTSGSPGTSANKAGLSDLTRLEAVLGLPPANAPLLPAQARGGAFRMIGVGSYPADGGTISGLGALQPWDRYYIPFLAESNNAIRSALADHVGVGADDPHFAALFLKNLAHVDTFITAAQRDIAIYAPAIPLTLATYTDIVESIDSLPGEFYVVYKGTPFPDEPARAPASFASRNTTPRTPSASISRPPCATTSPPGSHREVHQHANHARIGRQRGRPHHFNITHAGPTDRPPSPHHPATVCTTICASCPRIWIGP